MAKWQVHAPNGRNLTINTGGAGDTKYVHGQITKNERAAKLFPQYFIPQFDMDDMPPTPPAPAPPTLEAELLKEEKEVEEKPQMLTEVPKAVDVAKEEKEDAEEAGDTVLVEKKKTRKRK